MKVNIANKEYYIDGYLKSNLDIVKETIKKDWDMVIVVDGIEGGGKSSMAQLVGGYLDPTLAKNLDRITFNHIEFKKAVIKAKRYSCVIYDEAIEFSSRSALSKMNKGLISMLAEIRQKNLFIIIVTPSFFECEKYLSIHRSRFLIHTYVGNDFERGFFSFYNLKKKKQLYFFGKKLYQYLIRPNFRGRFSKGYIVNEKKYRAKKLQAMNSHSDNMEDIKYKIYMDQRNALLKFIHNDLNIEYKNIKIGFDKYTKHALTMNGIKESVLERYKEKTEPEEIEENGRSERIESDTPSETESSDLRKGIY